MKSKKLNITNETASASSTSSGSIATSAASSQSIIRRYGAPAALQAVNDNGTVKNALDMKTNIFGGKLPVTTKRKKTNEALADLASSSDRDHEVQMARAELYQIAEYALKLHKLLAGISEEQGLEGWVQSKITKSADYMDSVWHHLAYQELEQSASPIMMPAAEGVDPYKDSLRAKLEEKAKSKAQQKFMGMVYATKKGEKPTSPAVAKAAKGMSKKSAKDYAATKHKGKPEHVKKDK